MDERRARAVAMLNADVEERVAEWHTALTSATLAEWLGWTEDDMRRWIADPSVIIEITARRSLASAARAPLR
jgi:hypothetical protein